jgi:hypothetical protein
MTIIFSKNGKNAKKIESSLIDGEDYLQNYVLENPEIIPVSDIDVETRLLVLTREFPTPSGPIDAIGIDQFGQVYIIETKLYKNPDKRRVVAQVLDYGAALWKDYDLDRFQIDLANQISKYSNESLTEMIQKFFDIGEDETNVIIDSMSKHIENGIFRFVVLMDRLQKRLKDLILFLNENSNFDIYAVEIEYYKVEENEIIIPKLFGGGVRKSSSIKRDKTATRSEKSIKYNEFWQHFVVYFDKVKNGFKDKKIPWDMWINIPSAVPKIAFTFIFYRGKFPAIQLWLGNKTKDENEEYYKKIKSHQTKLEGKFPNLIWYNKPENKSKIIIFHRDEEYDFSEEKREEVMKWFSETMQKFEEIFNPILENLDKENTPRN